MLDYSLLPGFFIAALLINISPGPEMICVISTTISSGKKQGLLASLGAATGSTVHVMLVALGLAVLLSTSLVVFTIVKIMGALYLCYLGIKSIVSRTETCITGKKDVKNSNGYRKGLFVGVLNPKSILFFLAFLPQFVNPETGSYSFQIVTLGLCTVVAGILVELIVIFLIDRIVTVISRKKRIMMLIDKLTGTVLICFGLKLALSTQAE